jgi:alpha-D-xyloside xylohydrolase
MKIEYQKNRENVIFNFEKGILKLQICSENIFRVVYAKDNLPKNESLIVINKSCGETKWNLEEKPDGYSITTKRIKADINNDGSICFMDMKGNILLKENGRELIPCEVLGENTLNTKQKFTITPDEALYGFGQIPGKKINHRNEEIKLVQANTYAVIPFMISTNNYGLLWDSCAKTIFKNNKNEMSFESEMGEAIEYYFIFGETSDEIIKGYRLLTGAAPLFGKWAYGYWQSKERYKDQAEVLSIAKEYRERQIPIDNLVQDWRYWGDNKYWSSMEWDKSIFPDPKGMMDELHEKYNMHLMISIWPALGRETNIYREMDSKNYLYNNDDHWTNGRVYDAFSTEAREIYWRYINKELFSAGIDAWWMDATEPEFDSSETQEITERGLKKCKTNALGNIAKNLNSYSLMTTKAVYEGQRAESSDKRVFILTRSGFAGQQRNAAATWSGDTGASWKVLSDQIPEALNFCMGGIPYWTMDIGAFFPDNHGGKYPEGVNDPAYRELYVRWFQFGAFCPLFRAHGTSTPREIWQFGEKGSSEYEALLKIDILRYRLMPYIYSLAAKITFDGYTIMRGLAMDFSHDKKALDIENEYMFGPSILVAPVLKEMYNKTKLPSEVITQEYLFTPESDKDGILAEYYADTQFGKLLYTQKDEKIDYSWIINYPREIYKPGFSVRWTGEIQTDCSGDHEIVLRSDDIARLWIDGNIIIERSADEKMKTTYKSINLISGKKHKIKLEYIQNKVDSVICLMWIKPSNTGKKDEQNLSNKMEIYLPKGNIWYDFWTGKKYEGGKSIEREVPLDILPLYIKSGSIIPMGPQIQYSTEKPADPVELRIYEGGNVAFDIYEDENDNYNYEKGFYSIIPIIWNDADRILTIGKQRGEFPGMLKERSFKIILVKENLGIGIDESIPEKVVKYEGEAVIVKF